MTGNCLLANGDLEPNGLGGNEPNGLGGNEPNGLGGNEPNGLGGNEPNGLGGNEPNGLNGNGGLEPGLCEVTVETATIRQTNKTTFILYKIIDFIIFLIC